MKRIVIESPYSGDVEWNIAYAKGCVRDSLNRGEAPIASHLLLTQPGILDDSNKEQRKLGIQAGHAWIEVAEMMAVYCDRGISIGMWQGIRKAKELHIPIEFRSLNNKKLYKL